MLNPCNVSGPALPKKMSGLRMVEVGNDVIISGGYSTDGTGQQKGFYKLSCVSQGCTWQSMTPELSAARNSHVAIVVPDNFDNCP